MRPVVTTATKSPVKSDYLGDIIHVIDKQTLETLGAQSVEDAFRLIGNISLSNSSGIKSLFMRGLVSGATKVLYNGIDLRNSMGINGAPFIDLIPIDNVERIEVLSGSSSTINGSGAIAGVINVITNTQSNNGYIQSTVSEVFTGLNHSASIGKHS